MYLEHFGLTEPPFRITPHTDFFFDGADRGATLEALLYAILHDEGIVKVSGEVGSGKTMLCRVLMERLPERVATIYVATPSLGRDEILYTIADELNLQFAQGRVALVLREIHEQLIKLYGEGRKVVILIDEAHAMPEETLEQVRLLSNLESSRHKLLQIVLFGQPELDAALSRPSLRQLKDRITHSFRMRALGLSEVGTYLSFRMRAAGYRGPDVFSPAAIARIARASDGLSRRINILADKSLLAAFAESVHAVTPRLVRKAINDSEFARVERNKRPLVIGAAAAAGLVLGVLAPWLFNNYATILPQSIVSSVPPTARQAEVSPVSARTPGAPAQGTALQTGQLQGTVVQVGVAPPAPAAAEPTPHAPHAPHAPAAMPNQPASTPREAGQASALPAAPVVAGASAPAAPLRVAQADARKLEVAAPKPTLLGPERSRRISGYSSGSARLLRERIAATRKLLDHEPDDAYSIELFQTDNGDAARMERFLGRARELVPMSELYVLPTLLGARYRIRVLFGTFPNREAAAQAEKRLPPRYQRAFQTTPRSFGELRASL